MYTASFGVDRTQRMSFTRFCSSPSRKCKLIWAVTRLIYSLINFVVKWSNLQSWATVSLKLVFATDRDEFCVLHRCPQSSLFQTLVARLLEGEHT